MPEFQHPGSPGTTIVVKFALTSLVVFVVIGIAITNFRASDVRDREEARAGIRSELVAQEIVRPLLADADLSRPLSGETLAAVDERIRGMRRTDPRFIRVKVWSTDGTVIYSDDPIQIGQRPELEGDLKEAIGGRVENEISDLTADENAEERMIADRLFETYVPVRFSEGGPVEAVVEVYQDYAVIQTEVDRLARTLTISLGLGLLALYLAMLPVMIGVTRTLRRQNQQLTEQAERLSELLEHEQQTVAELRELDRLKGDFVAAASHELRTPLTSIRGYVAMLKDASRDADPTTQEAVAAIERQSSRLLRLVTNVLRASRVETETEPDAIEAVDLAATMDEVRADFLEASERIRVEVPAGLPVVRADRERLVEITTNLVDNALKYSPRSEPVILSAGVGAEDLFIRVSDRGSGIDPHDVPRIFDRFFQLDGSATRMHGGVGLGLHIVRGLVESLGGRIQVDSAPSVGSIFTVTIPLAAEDRGLLADRSTTQGA
jgi:signal transduction histidine kinase